MKLKLKFASTFDRMQLHTVLAVGATLLYTVSATAGIHTWDVVEVFSNVDGTIQYVELLDLGVNGTEINVGNGSLSSNTQTFLFASGVVAPPTNGKSFLVATAGFAALTGAPVPDVIIPAINVPFFNPSGDVITFVNGDALVVSAVPTNGTDSFDEATGIGPNTPKNYAGVEGNVTAAPEVPSWSERMVIPTVSLLAIAGYASLRQRSVSVA